MGHRPVDAGIDRFSGAQTHVNYRSTDPDRSLGAGFRQASGSDPKRTFGFLNLRKVAQRSAQAICAGRTGALSRNHLNQKNVT